MQSSSAESTPCAAIYDCNTFRQRRDVKATNHFFLENRGMTTSRICYLYSSAWMELDSPSLAGLESARWSSGEAQCERN